MPGRSHERRHFFRGKSRPDRVVPVRYRTPEIDDWVIAETRNIGVGGAFIACDATPPIGTTLTIELALPGSGTPFTLPAVVRWAGSDGMGVQFVGVDVDVLLELNDYFATLV